MGLAVAFPKAREAALFCMGGTQWQPPCRPLQSDAVTRWRYKPLTIDGKPVKFCYFAKFVFKPSPQEMH
jgi:hypothetical protein